MFFRVIIALNSLLNLVSVYMNYIERYLYLPYFIIFYLIDSLWYSKKLHCIPKSRQPKAFAPINLLDNFISNESLSYGIADCMTEKYNEKSFRSWQRIEQWTERVENVLLLNDSKDKVFKSSSFVHIQFITPIFLLKVTSECSKE